LQALHALGVVICDEIEYGEAGRSRWFYTLAEDIDPTPAKLVTIAIASLAGVGAP
jgi:hypothetical protein